MTAKVSRINTDDLIKKHLSGLSATQLARQHGVTQKVIVRLLGSEYRTRSQLAAMHTDSIVARYTSGESCKSIADSFWFDRPTVIRILTDAGISVRGRSEAECVKWSRMTGEQRAAQVSSAHQSVRGMKRGLDELCKRAQSHESSRVRDTAFERHVIDSLSERGVTDIIPQKAIGPYNCDIAAGPVAVEVFSGYWHWHGRHFARTEERFRYIMDAGYDIIVMAISKSHPFTPAVADYFASEVQKARSNPPGVRQYRVIWGAGEFETGGRLDDDHFSIEPPFKSVRDAATGQYKTIPK